MWDKLAPGPHAVGFKSTWQFDYSRRYNTTFDDKTSYASGKAPRPILVNIWYPADKTDQSKRMAHRDYWKIPSNDPVLAKFSAKLSEYERSVVVKEVMGKPEAELNPEEKFLLEGYLGAPTKCLRDAAPVPGSFPLVVYHSGAMSSYEDNAALCELLASHGFVVLGSAFQRRNGSSLAPDGEEGSASDLAFLIAYARQVPGADWGHVGVVGHSLGAHAALLYGSRAGCLADAIVSLDTTQDYSGLKETRWDYFTTPVTKNAGNFTRPLLMVAAPHAFFELADSLSSARRYYFTVKDLDHNDYVSQGVTSKHRLYRLHSGAPSQPVPLATKIVEKANFENARDKYQAVCLYVLRFLQAELKGDAAAKKTLATQYRETKLGDDDPHVEFMEAGKSGPEPYFELGALPPTPRQVRPFLRRYGREKTIAIYKRFRNDSTRAPIYYENYMLNLVSDLLDEGKAADAVAFSNHFRDLGLDCNKFFLSVGKQYQELGRRDLAARYFERVLGLEPSNREANTRLKELRTIIGR